MTFPIVHEHVCKFCDESFAANIKYQVQQAEADRDRLASALEQAEKERDEAREQANGWETVATDANGVLYVKRAEAAEREVEGAATAAVELAMQKAKVQAERDRLAAALERLAVDDGQPGAFRAYARQVAHEALNPGDGE